MSKGTILYIGGFQLPDKNAAALRVLTNGKAFRELGYDVIFVNALIETETRGMIWTSYDKFKCIEYSKENQIEYLLRCKRMIALIQKTNATIVIAYNYPAIALNRLRKYCQKNNIKCIADATEWYVPTGNIMFRIAKGFDSELRMRYVHRRMDGVIAISDYLYRYYKEKVRTAKIPPLVDIQDDKWKTDNTEKNIKGEADEGVTKLIYAGSPSAQKERLDVIVEAVEKAALLTEIRLIVVGITAKQYAEMYGKPYCGSNVKFLGRISNIEVIRLTKESDWTIVLRDKNKVVEAGFPTKVPESIACGTPIIANQFSNISEYLNSSNSILIQSIADIGDALSQISKIKKTTINNNLFDYRNFVDLFRDLMD